jgi:hypothetical protein
MIGLLEIIGGVSAILLALGAVAAARPAPFRRITRNADAAMLREVRACKRQSVKYKEAV